MCRLIALAILLAAHNDLLYQCETGHLLRLYYVGTLLQLSVTIILSTAIVYVSARGTIADDRPRVGLTRLLYARTALLLPDLAWTAIGTKWAFKDEAGTKCPPGAVVVVRSVVIVSWLLQLAFVIFILLFFDPLGRPSTRPIEDSQRLWKKRFCFIVYSMISDFSVVPAKPFIYLFGRAFIIQILAT